MNTIVFQSFRPHNVPRWIERCLASVRSWAEASGFTYRLIDDAFLALAPDWYRAKTNEYITLVTDLARLVYARQCLLDGFNRAIWVDADVIVFCPSSLRVDPNLSCGYCREVWVDREESGAVVPDPKVNNAVCQFTNEAIEHLESYIDHCYSTIRELPEIRDGLEVGTRYLSATHSSKALILNVGLINPVIMQAILEDDEDLLARYIEWQGSYVYAANLCHSIRRFFGPMPGLYDCLCNAVVEKLIANQGGVLAHPLSSNSASMAAPGQYSGK
jgi:hypothetical protein